MTSSAEIFPAIFFICFILTIWTKCFKFPCEKLVILIIYVFIFIYTFLLIGRIPLIGEFTSKTYITSFLFPTTVNHMSICKALVTTALIRLLSADWTNLYWTHRRPAENSKSKNRFGGFFLYSSWHFCVTHRMLPPVILTCLHMLLPLFLSISKLLNPEYL